MSTFLPEVAPQDLIIWDRERSQCCGYLLKQASKSSAFNRGKWQKRWVFININLEDDENYCLEYSHGPEDKTASQSFSLVNCNIKISVENTFMLTYMDEVLLTLKAEDADEMKEWIRTIENVTVVANAREKILDADDEEDDDEEVGRGKGNRKELRQMILNKKNSGAGAKVKDTEKAKEKKFFKKKKADDENEEQEESEEESEEGSVRIVRTGFSRTPLRLFPTLRIDVDIDSIPPASTDRHLLLESFVNDIANALSITPAWVDVVSVKAAPGMNWLTQIEFDINVPLPQMDEAEKNDEEYVDALQSERFEIRSKLLLSLRELVSDEASPIYNGLITCKLDPSFCEHFADDASSETGEIKPFSADAKVLALMNKYKDIEVPEGTLDVSHFTILLYFEKRMAAVHVPNPMVVAKRSCNLWPFEVKQALGFTGTMQELWLDPIALIPRDMPKSLSQPIYFEPSVRYNGALLINATKLKADLAYNVLFEDRRDDLMDNLTEDEMEAIKETFQAYDINHDGGISKQEMDILVNARTEERRRNIEDKFREFISDPDASEEDIRGAELNKAQYLQQLRESRAKLLDMFAAADTNGDGVISFTEFIMAEAWWLRCTLNPDKAHLF